MNSQHTPTPLKVDKNDYIVGPDNEPIARLMGSAPYNRHYGNFITLACNNHEGLVKVVERVIPWLKLALCEGVNDNTACPNDLNQCIDQAQAILSSVQGKESK